ncbi:hypothetical protein [Fodinibius sp. Rm-B-1B1-1]|uniref:hypothetical protein n=1 Tax=Fodinibius alkaliphilus TaxID=3140241 RepID=UPI00315A579D
MSKTQKTLIAISLIFFAGLGVLLIYQSYAKPGSQFVSNIGSYSNVILAGLTLVYVFLTYLILRSNNQSIKEQNRPYIVVSFPYINHRLDLKVKNIGNRPAKNVSISFDPDLSAMFTESYRESYKNMITQKFMPPGFSANDMIGISFDTMKTEKENREINVSVEYEDLENNEYSHDYEIHVHNYLYSDKVVTRDKRYQLEKMREAMEKIQKLLKNKLR